MNEALDLVFNYNRKIVESNICNDKFENMKKNIELLKENPETKPIADSMGSSVTIMQEKVEVLSKEREELKEDLLNKVSTLNDTDKEELFKYLETYSKNDPTYQTIYNELKD